MRIGEWIVLVFWRNKSMLRPMDIVIAWIYWISLRILGKLWCKALFHGIVMVVSWMPLRRWRKWIATRRVHIAMLVDRISIMAPPINTWRTGWLRYKVLCCSFWRKCIVIGNWLMKALFSVTWWRKRFRYHIFWRWRKPSVVVMPWTHHVYTIIDCDNFRDRYRCYDQICSSHSNRAWWGNERTPRLHR
jgi:hypothetical protein